MPDINVPSQTKPSSWAEKVRVSDSSMRCNLEQMARRPAGSILKIPHDMQLANVDIWHRSMIGFFVSYKLPFHAVQTIANRIWRTHGLEKTTVMSNGFMIFRFSTEEAVGEILARGPWMFGGKTILLQKWQPGFQFDKNKIRTIPVWARLQGLPFPLWNKKGLSMAASMVGKPIASDEATMQCTRLEYARVCVEIDAEVPLVHSFKVMSTLSEEPISVDVSYEWKPARCATCRVFGHSCKGSEKQVDLTVKEKEGEEIALNVISSKSTAEKEGNITVQVQEPVIAKVLPTKLQTREAEGSSTESHQNAHKEGDKQTDLHDHHTLSLENKMASVTSGSQGTGQVKTSVKGKEIARDASDGDGKIQAVSPTEGKCGEREACESSSNDRPPDSLSWSSPKTKKKKGGKKKREDKLSRQ
ncbi:hypothetical protein OIU78_018995 [Salix suchowensis]|nr:hypothetical protein OIU78_018995 [Salix suchowensis]